MIITIDGVAASGKTTTAKNLAKELLLPYFSSGVLYRCYALFCLRNAVDMKDHKLVRKSLKKCVIAIKTEANAISYFINDKDVTENLRSEEVSKAVIDCAKIPAIRNKVYRIHKKLAKKAGGIFEGRDMGTKVFPEADLKIFMTASQEIRAQRRCKDLQKQYPQEEHQEQTVLSHIAERDYHDINRKLSPLRKTADMVVIDTSKLSQDAVIATIIAELRKRGISKKNIFYRLAHFLTTAFFKIFYEVKTAGIEKIPPGGVVVVTDNFSCYSALLVTLITKTPLLFLADKKFFSIPFIGRMMHWMGAIPIENNVPSPKIVKKMVALLKRGKKVGLFYRKRSESVDKEFYLLATKTKSPVIPVFIKADRIWGKRAFPKFFKKIHCIVGDPLFIEKFTADESMALLEKHFKKLADLI